LTGGQEAVDSLAENYYGQFIKMAVEEEWRRSRVANISKSAASEPARRIGERLLQTKRSGISLRR
jgi:hypothetical protein